LGGVITRVKAARIKLCHSRLALVIVYPNEQLEMVMSAHEEAFKFFAGCCENGIYDNMKTLGVCCAFKVLRSVILANKLMAL
jgi:transposase